MKEAGWDRVTLWSILIKDSANFTEASMVDVLLTVALKGSDGARLLCVCKCQSLD